MWITSQDLVQCQNPWNLSIVLISRQKASKISLSDLQDLINIPGNDGFCTFRSLVRGESKQISFLWLKMTSSGYNLPSLQMSLGRTSQISLNRKFLEKC